MKRPGWQEVESLLNANEIKGVVIYKLDRLTRNLGDWSYLIKNYFRDRVKHPKQLHSYSEKIDTSTATGRMFLNLVVMISEWEREIIAERTRDGLGVKRTRGEKLGGRMPFGKILSEDGITLVDEPGQQEAIAEMRRLQSEGITLRQIAAMLQQMGIETAGGNAIWTRCGPENPTEEPRWLDTTPRDDSLANRLRRMIEDSGSHTTPSARKPSSTIA